MKELTNLEIENVSGGGPNAEAVRNLSAFFGGVKAASERMPLGVRLLGPPVSGLFVTLMGLEAVDKVSSG